MQTSVSIFPKLRQYFTSRTPLRLLKRPFILFAGSLALGAVFMGCGRGDDILVNSTIGRHDPIYSTATSSVFVSGADIYVAGIVNVTIDATSSYAVLWKNGVIQYLTGDNIGSYTSSVFASGNDVYVAGVMYMWREGISDAVLWKNGTPQRLTVDGCHSSFANSVFVSGGDVYAAGGAYTYRNGQLQYVPVFWKNGAAQLLNEGSKAGMARSVFVSEDDVYVAGFEKSDNGQDNIAVIWKNGSHRYLTDGSANADVSSIFVADDDVYAVGSDGPAAMLWKNGVPQRLTVNGNNASGARSVFVSGGDVYITGSQTNTTTTGIIPSYNSYAILWKNGSPQYLTDGSKPSSGAVSVFVYENDVYVAGIENKVATLWKNGVPQRLNR